MGLLPVARIPAEATEFYLLHNAQLALKHTCLYTRPIPDLFSRVKVAGSDAVMTLRTAGATILLLLYAFMVRRGITFPFVFTLYLPYVI